jgi:dTDP-4-amino-4,6-dideoxygalactose transaminase
MRSQYLAFGRPDFTEEEIDAVSRVLRSGWIGMGGETLAFEAELAGALGAPHVVTVNSCTSALFLSLLVVGARAGDEVVCPSLTWCSTANAALYLGATPVFCDVDERTLNATPETVREAVTDRTAAVVVVHFGGRAADIDAIRRAIPARVAIVEDAAHALGARLPDGRPVGSSGNLTCFSFYANKNISTAEGGAIALSDPLLADRLRSLRQHGLPIDAWKRFTNARTVLLSGDAPEIGYKMNYTDLQACIGRVQLRRFAALQARRAAVASCYRARLRVQTPSVGVQDGIESDAHARHLFVIRLPIERLKCSRNDLLHSFRAQNLGVSIHYRPLHHMRLYRQLGRSASLPVTDDLWARIMTLPIGSAMTVADAGEVVDHLAAELSRHAR